MAEASHIVVAGAGAIGRTVAYLLARAGHAVTVIDPDPETGAQASRIAAGMLAPAFEALFDEAPVGLLREALALWRPLAREIGLPIAWEGAMAPGDRAQAEAWCAALADLGVEAELRDLGDDYWAAYSDEDRQLDPELALQLLRGAAERLGARYQTGRVTGFADGSVRIEGAEPMAADRLVVATGAGQALVDLAPALAVLEPIKGHVLRTPGAFAGVPVVRGPSVYLCRTPWGTVLGATMEPGRSDEAVDPDIVEDLLERASALSGGLRRLSWTAAAGVRASTPDGLPLVGEAREGLILAVGARRNGWLLAPMIAEVVLDAVAGRPRGAAAQLFDPGRFQVGRFD
ncbi:MAG TPA: FAD-dependent oxidoreductase [Caulobacteraceae bacterium]|jgi:glycine oxidase|nr:FAD-dependent oxidoreductase [Caulobacteraceae bacterium]